MTRTAEQRRIAELEETIASYRKAAAAAAIVLQAQMQRIAELERELRRATQTETGGSE